MKCDELKNKILESHDLDELCQDHGVSAHLESCQLCRNSFKYEQTLRKGFDEIARQAPPAQLAAKIFAIPAQEKKSSQAEVQTDFMSFIRSFFAGFPLKTAFVSCMIGFFAAVMLQNHSEMRVTEPVTEVSKSNIDSNAPSPSLNKSKDDLVVAQAKRSKKAEAPAAFTSSEEKVNPSKERADEHIPGAISFSIAEGEETRTKGVARARREVAAKLALSPEIKQEKPVLALAESEFADSISSNFAADEADSGKATASRDPRALELETLLRNLSPETGFLNLRELAARGVIESTRLEYFSPPPGMKWFVQFEEEKIRVILKKEK